MGPDNYWFGARPRIVLERRGAGVDTMIDRIRVAVARYPYPHTYRAWPGPNSNTFTAYIARQVPELGLDLPSNAVGKDFWPGGALFAMAPSGSGLQVSLYGLAGILLAVDEGVELNVFGPEYRCRRRGAGAKAASDWPIRVGPLILAGNHLLRPGSRFLV
jgi:hypothetical protein